MAENKDSNQQMFLATTAINAFWDTSKKMVFLADGCLIHECREQWERLDYEVPPSPYTQENSLKGTFEFVSATYESLLPQVARLLNDIHQENLNLKSWRIIVGPWLYLYVSVLYDRLLHLDNAYKLYPDIDTTTLDDTCFITCATTLDFAYSIKYDPYNLQLYSQLINAKGHKHNSKKQEIKSTLQNAKQSLVSNIVRLASRFVNRLTPCFASSLVLRHSYIPRTIELGFIFKHFGSIFPSVHKECLGGEETLNQEARKALSNVCFGPSDFEKSLSALLHQNMPLCFVENFKLVQSESKKYYPSKVKSIFSATSWYWDESFKYWSAKSAESGSKLIGTQHGGVYGSFQFLGERHEKNILDSFYTWGWRDSDITKPMPATKFIGLNPLKKTLNLKKILWGATTFNRHLSQHPFLPTFNNQYSDWQLRFVKGLSDEIVSNLAHRPHLEGFDKCILSKLKEAVPNLHIETWDVGFRESLSASCIFVCDHNSTTFLEAFCLNHPTVVFWNPEHYLLNDSAKPYYDMLIDAGVLFYNPETAAKALVRAYQDVEAWWSEPSRQQAVKAFCDQFAKTSQDAVKIWDNELAQILEA